MKHETPFPSLKNGKNRGTTVPAINFNQLISLSALKIFSRNAVIIHKLRIGHTWLTDSYLLSGTDQPECLACHCPLTAKHILIECPALTSTCNKHFTASSMKDLFDNVATRNIINFIKESHFYITVYCCYHIFYISSKP